MILDVKKPDEIQKKTNMLVVLWFSFVDFKTKTLNVKLPPLFVSFQSEDASNELTYSQVDFSCGAAASLNSAPHGNADNVIYSVPQVGTSSDGRNTTDASPPLYSTVTLHQP